MKRDWELIRLILTRLEDQDPNAPGLSADGFEGYESSVVAYHFHMLEEAGLISAQIIADVQHRYAGGIATRLTWDGQEFLSKIRSDTVWAKVKKSIADKGLSLGFDAIKAAATWYLKSQFAG